MAISKPISHQVAILIVVAKVDGHRGNYPFFLCIYKMGLFGETPPYELLFSRYLNSAVSIEFKIDNIKSPTNNSTKLK